MGVEAAMGEASLPHHVGNADAPGTELAAYFDRARAVALLTAGNPVFADFYADKAFLGSGGVLLLLGQGQGRLAAGAEGVHHV